MAALNSSEIWKIIPPEEKIEVMAQSHCSGVLASMIFIVLFSTIAIGMQIRSLIWFSLIFSPIIFQYFSGIKWKKLKPKMILEYLAARSASRRYAYATNGRDLTLLVLFRGQFITKKNFGDIDPGQVENSSEIIEKDVWISLFGDTIILISEAQNGAILEFGHFIDNKIRILSSSVNDKNVRNKSVTLSYTDKRTAVEMEVGIKSKYPGALYVFEKKLESLMLKYKKGVELHALAETMIKNKSGFDEDDDIGTSSSSSSRF